MNTTKVFGDGGIRYCCYGAFCDIGCSDDCPTRNKLVDNVVRVKFRESAVNLLMEDFREVIRKPAYDEVTFCELIGVIEMIKLEYYERNTNGSDV